MIKDKIIKESGLRVEGSIKRESNHLLLAVSIMYLLKKIDYYNFLYLVFGICILGIVPPLSSPSPVLPMSPQLPLKFMTSS